MTNPSTMAAPEGSQVGFIDGYGVRQSFTQTLSDMLQPGATYTLQIEVGGVANGGLGRVSPHSEREQPRR